APSPCTALCYARTCAAQGCGPARDGNARARDPEGGQTCRVRRALLEGEEAAAVRGSKARAGAGVPEVRHLPACEVQPRFGGDAARRAVSLPREGEGCRAGSCLEEAR